MLKSEKKEEKNLSFTAFIPLIILLVYVLIICFAVYFLITILRFMKDKTQNDGLLLQKVDELSQKLDELKNDKAN